ncbi:MAG: biotin transporter BioY [Lachnospiraceae bacterium]|nr:biotin transporter BioY [Lachnospiraceae bacterium]
MNRKLKTIDLAYMAVGAVLITVCSWISIPSAVPFTLQTFAVFCVLGLLGGKRGTISIAVYILLGIIGIPVFSGFKGGFGVIIGTTGGYIVGFIFMGLIYWLAEVIWKQLSCGTKLKTMVVRGAVMAFGLLVCYAFGTAWFMVAYARNSGPVGLATALGWCVIPFIIPDIIKLVVSVIITGRLKRFIK